MKKGNINLKDRIKDIKIKENIYLFVIYLVLLFKFICLDFGIFKNIEPPIYTYSVYSNNYGFIKFVRWANFVVTIIIVFFLTLTFRFKENKPEKVANQEKRKITKRIFSVSMSFVVTCTLIMVNILADTYLGILYELVEYSNECYLYEIAERVGDSYAALRDNGVDKFKEDIL